MATTDNFIAAIEIGSSKITGMVGRRMADGSIQILACAKENSGDCIRRGTVHNVDKTSECLKNIKQRLQDVVKKNISKVYVCIGGQSLHSVLNTVSRDFETETKINQEIVDALYEEDRNLNISDYWLMKIIPQDYYLGKQRQASSSSSVVGVVSDKLEGSFLNVFYRHSFYENIKECLVSVGFKKVEYMMTPIVLGDGLLSMDAKRTGCVLVDFGKDTTSVAVYSSKLLRRLAVIPLGSGNITKDIASVFRIEESEAEMLKCEYGSAFSEKDVAEDASDKIYTLSDGRDINARELNEIVEARMEEILINVEEQIRRSGLKASEDLISGAILTGGGSNLRDLGKAFKQYTKIGEEKIKFAKYVNFQVNTKYAEAKQADGTLNAILSLLTQGKEECAGDIIPEEQGLFEEVGRTPQEDTNEGKGRDNITELNPETPEEEPQQEQTKKPGKFAKWFKKLGNGIKNTADKLVSPEE